MTNKRGVRRRATQNKSPAWRDISKYLTTSTLTRVFPMPHQGFSLETVCTAIVDVTWGVGIGNNGLVIPENPGRNITQFGGFSITQNNSYAKYLSLFDEVRVKAILTEYQPHRSAGVAVTTPLGMIALCDYDSELAAGVLTTSLSAAQYSTARLLSIDTEHQLVYKPTVNRSFTTWFSTADTSARGCVYYFLGSNSVVAFSAGNILIKYILEFRNPTA